MNEVMQGCRFLNTVCALPYMRVRQTSRRPSAAISPAQCGSLNPRRNNMSILSDRKILNILFCKRNFLTILRRTIINSISMRTSFFIKFISLPSPCTKFVAV